jgi:phosphoribosyl 1,2-cyclic phosphodiesterase
MRYGGNTSCVSVQISDDNILVLDAGTGIRTLGKALQGSTAAIFVLLSHGHWDHLQGAPFFCPIYQPARTVYLFPPPSSHALGCAALAQLDGAHFPVTPEALPSYTACITQNVLGFLQQHGFHLTTLATNHPGGGAGYRLEHAGRSVVYLTDNELYPPYAPATAFEEFVDFCQGTDLLIHDAQYLDSDMPHKHGWGHSLVPQVCALATAAQARHLVLYHHDPDRTDDEVDAIQEMARAWLSPSAPSLQCTAAYEGLTLCV